MIMRRMLIPIILVLTLAIMSGCVGVSKHDGKVESEGSEVLVTFHPYKLMMDDLGIKAELLIPPNLNPHTYSPRIKDLEKVKKAKLIVADGFTDSELIKDIDKDKVYIAGYAPHSWLDLRVFINLTEAMKIRGYEINESAEEEARKLLDTYKNKIKIKAIALHKLLKEPLKVYGIEIVDELLTHEHEELSLNDIERMNNEGADVIIVTNEEQKKMLEGKVNKEIFVLDIMEINRGEKGYLETMKKNLEGLYGIYKKAHGQ